MSRFASSLILLTALAFAAMAHADEPAAHVAVPAAKAAPSASQKPPAASHDRQQPTLKSQRQQKPHTRARNNSETLDFEKERNTSDALKKLESDSSSYSAKTKKNEDAWKKGVGP